MAKSKYTLKSGPFSFVFWPEISTSLGDPLGCSDLSQIFFGSSPTATEWDKIVAEIIHKTFVFLRHPYVQHYFANISATEAQIFMKGVVLDLALASRSL